MSQILFLQCNDPMVAGTLPISCLAPRSNEQLDPLQSLLQDHVTVPPPSVEKVTLLSAANLNADYVSVNT